MYREGELTRSSQLGIVCTLICLVISAFAEETLPRYAHTGSEASPHVLGPCCTRASPRYQHGAKSSRAHMPWCAQSRNHFTAKGCRIVSLQPSELTVVKPGHSTIWRKVLPRDTAAMLPIFKSKLNNFIAFILSYWRIIRV